MRVLITTAIILGLPLAAWYSYNTWLKQPEVISYRTIEVQRGDLTSTVSATGTIEPLLKVLVGSQVSGTVMRWYADFNDEVEEGFILAELDQDRYKATAEQRAAAVAVARARVEESAARLQTARLERERIGDAFRRQAASDFEYRSTQAAEAASVAALHAAEAQLQAAEAELRQAEVELDKTIIRSPMRGLVISRDVDAGQTVAASLSAPTLFTIANDLTRMRVNAAVSETDIGRVKEGMPAEFRVDAYPGKRFQGRVAQVRFAETVVDNVVTYTTLIDVDNPELLLRPGMTATILFEVDRIEDALLVSNAALRFSPPAGAAVLAASDRGASAGDGRAAPRAAQAGDAGDPSAVREASTGEDSGRTAARRVSDVPVAAGDRRPQGPQGNGAGTAPGRSSGSAPGAAAGRGLGGRGGLPPARVYRLEGDTLVEVPIRAGMTDGRNTVVLDGDLKQGDRIVVDLGDGAVRSRQPTGGIRAPGTQQTGGPRRWF